MNSLAISLAVGASALFMSAASAAPLSADASVTPGSNVQKVRMVCNENGRCWREHGERRVIIREPGDSYGYAPRERYIERRGYDEDRGGVGFRAPGVSVGIGTDRYWVPVAKENRGLRIDLAHLGEHQRLYRNATAATLGAVVVVPMVAEKAAPRSWRWQRWQTSQTTCSGDNSRNRWLASISKRSIAKARPVLFRHWCAFDQWD
jgi:hypothetical protein